MRFYLGTHQTNHLAETTVPLFVSRRRLEKRKQLPRARGPWALDSGGFTELRDYGKWTLGPQEYADEVIRYQAGVGRLEWAAVQDYMCEPQIIQGGPLGPGQGTAVGTGLSVLEHQARTIQSLFDLQELAGDVWWVPVLQGYEVDEYLSHVEQYRQAGVRLETLPLVGVGSVCRRQGTKEVEVLMKLLRQEGIRTHGFGFKTEGLKRAGQYMESADSMAWSFHARRNPHKRGTPQCTHVHCGNCLPFALEWRTRLLAALEGQVPAPLGRLRGGVPNWKQVYG